MPTRAEMPGRNKKPWQQKGLGKARHGSRLSPQWMHGGVAHGPRGPKSYFFMEGFYQRIAGLTTALTVKFHQVITLFLSFELNNQILSIRMIYTLSIPWIYQQKIFK